MKNYEDLGYNQYSFGHIHSLTGILVSRHDFVDGFNFNLERRDKDKNQSMVVIGLYGS